MSIHKNGSPKAVLNGVDDQSMPPLVLEPVRVPIHLPLMFTFASEGPEDDAYVVAGDNMFSLYGRDINDVRSPYATINTPFLEMFNRMANPQMIQRLVPEDATKASLRFYVEVLETETPVYERGATGAVMYNSDGSPKTKGTKPGLLIVWRTGVFSEEAGLFKQGKQFEGSLTNKDGKKSVVYPVLDFPAPYRGRRPNDRGIRISCPNVKSAEAVDPSIVETIQSRLMSVQFMERPAEDLSPMPMKTLDGASSVSFSFKPGAYYRPMRQDLDAKEVVVPSYRKLEHDEGMVPQLGPVEDMYVYQDNLELVLKLAQTKINTHVEAEGDFGTTLTDEYLVDIFSGQDVEGNPYNGLLVDSGDEGGVILSDKHTHFLDGGSDGTMTNDVFDKMVREEMLNFGRGTVNYLNMAKYPCSFMWDVGYSTDTKQALANFMGRLKTTMVVLSTHVYNRGRNNMATENSMKLATSGFLAAHPEAILFGTPACRGAVVGHSYLLNDSDYKERVPATYSLAKFTAMYAGAQEGKFQTSHRFDRGELAIVDDGRDLNLTYKTDEAYSSDWEKGLINIRSYDQSRYYFPALYTVYPYDRSIMNGYLNAVIAADLERVAFTVWSEMSGSQSLTDEQIAKRVTDKIHEKVAGKYDGIVDIEAKAYFTAADKSNGYSITIDIYMYGNVMKTVHEYTIIAKRREG